MSVATAWRRCACTFVSGRAARGGMPLSLWTTRPVGAASGDASVRDQLSDGAAGHNVLTAKAVRRRGATAEPSTGLEGRAAPRWKVLQAAVGATTHRRKHVGCSHETSGPVASEGDAIPGRDEIVLSYRRSQSATTWTPLSPRFGGAPACETTATQGTATVGRSV